jgi:hypothetical protein
MHSPTDGPPVSRFLVELKADDGFADIQAMSDRSRAACAQMRAEDFPVRFLRSLFVPEQGTCFLLFEADSAPVVAEAARRAHVPKAVVWELHPT